MNIRELFDVEVAVPLEVENHTVTFYFRNAKTEEELEFRRRTSRQRINGNGSIESSDSALQAPMYLFKAQCTRITLANGDGSPAQDVPKEEWSAIPDQHKLDAWVTFRSRVKKKEAQDLLD